MASSPIRFGFDAVRRLDAVVALLLAAATLLMLVVYFPLPADDAYIVARYARQLHDGNGLVFNPGERINAITSPLLTWVHVVIYPLSREPVDVYRIAAAVLTAWTLVAIARRAYPAKADGLLFLAVTLASPFVCFWAVGGLETPLLLGVCSWLTWLALSAGAKNGRRRAAQVISLATVAVLTRYDSVLYVAPVAALCLFRYRRDRGVLAVAAACAATVAAWVAFTYAYYGDVLPTSFYVKLAGGEGGGEFARGLGYLASFGVLALALPLAFGAPWKRGRVIADRGNCTGALALGAGAEMVYAIFAGDKHMMYAYRLFVPYLPSLALLLFPAGREGPMAEGNARRALWVIVCLAYQTSLAACLYYLSENPNLSLLFRDQDVRNQVYEFSTIGARYTRPFLAAVRASAGEVEAHWRAVSAGRSRPMRIAVLTGGTLPYRLPQAYALESLVSYRHRCSGNLASFADYAQVVQNADAPFSSAQLFGGDATWQLISKHEMTVDGLQNKPYRLRIDIWYQERPAPMILPQTIDAPCGGA